VIIVNSWVNHQWKHVEVPDSSIMVEQPTHRQSVLLAYVKYTKGGEDEVTMGLSANEDTINDGNEFFEASYLSGQRVLHRIMHLQHSSSFRIPFALSLNEDKTRVSIDFVISGPGTMGTIEVWLKPASMQF
jgi:hypothetical protein